MADSYPIEWVELGQLEPGAQAFVTTDVLPVPGGVIVRNIVHVLTPRPGDGSRQHLQNSSMTATFVPNAELDMTDPDKPALRFSTRHHYA